MASVHDYKRLENKFVSKIKYAVVVVAGFVLGFFKAFWRFLTRRYTLVFVPHSEKKVYNLHVTVLSICLFFFVFAGIIGGVFVYGASFNTSIYSASGREGRLDAEASLDQFRDETALLVRESRRFTNALTEVFSKLGVRSRSPLSQNTTGDLSTFLGLNESLDGVLPEINELRRLTEILSESIEPILEIGNILDSQINLLTEIPSIWPVRGNAGRISMFFGVNRHPIFGQYYIHRGIDIITFRAGDAILATADGQVVTAEYDSGYGNNIIIRHKHGFYTRYAHMQNFRVQIGQRVKQGDVIGYIGSTGISTGPHLHYEVHVGSDVVDPYPYLNFRPSLSRQSR
jgi:murein DD-endopeptidase MepM/ murein hydrolase activator NlpD